MKKKGLTIDDLAGMVKRGFDRVDDRFDQMAKEFNARFDRVDERLGKLEDEVENFKIEMAEVKGRLETLEHLVRKQYVQRITKLEREVEKLKHALALT